MDQPTADEREARWKRFLEAVRELPRDLYLEALRDYVLSNGPIGATHSDIRKRQEGPSP